MISRKAPPVFGILALVLGLLHVSGDNPVWADPASAAVEVKQQIQKLHSSVPDDRAKAADELARLGSKAATAANDLAAMLADEAEAKMFCNDGAYHVEVRYEAARALAAIGPPGVELLLQAVKDRNSKVRSAAVRGLDSFTGRGTGPFREPRVVSALIACMDDSDREVRSNAVWGLYHAGNERAMAALAKAMHDADAGIADQAAGSLGDIGKPAVEYLLPAAHDRDPAIRARGIAAFLGSDPLPTSAATDRRVLETLVFALTDADAKVRQAAFHSAKSFDNPNVVDAVIAALKSKDRDTRLQAIHALEHKGRTRAVAPLAAVLEDDDFLIRRDAAEALGQIQDHRAVEPLLTRLKDPYAQVRAAVACALGVIGDPRAVDPLIAALKDADKQVRSTTAIALGDIKDQRALEPLRAALNDPEPPVRRYAIFGLAQLGDRQGRDGLIAELQDPDADIRKSAVMCLSEMEERRALGALEKVSDADPDIDIRNRASAAIQHIRDHRK